jgi:hypothetical protein
VRLTCLLLLIYLWLTPYLLTPDKRTEADFDIFQNILKTLDRVIFAILAGFFSETIVIAAVPTGRCGVVSCVPRCWGCADSFQKVVQPRVFTTGFGKIALHAIMVFAQCAAIIGIISTATRPFRVRQDAVDRKYPGHWYRYLLDRNRTNQPQSLNLSIYLYPSLPDKISSSYLC